MKQLINFACVIILLIAFSDSTTGCDPTFCSRVRCIGVSSAEECKPGEKFVPYDPQNCVCCNYCKKICSSEEYSTDTEGNCKKYYIENTIELIIIIEKIIPSQCSDGEDPATFCQLVDCQPTAITPSDCSKDQIFAEVDQSKCICCTQCIDKPQSNCN